MMALDTVKFDSLTEMIGYVRQLTSADKVKILKGYGYDVESMNSTRKLELIADYIVQGLHFGKAGAELVDYANDSADSLIEKMPFYGKVDPDTGLGQIVRGKRSVAIPVNTIVPELVVSSVVNPTPIVESLPVAKPTVKKAPKVAPKAEKVKSVKSTKVKHPDFTIVFRADRNGYEGWFGGKAEAFRDTVEKIQSFFNKKYGQSGTVLS